MRSRHVATFVSYAGIKGVELVEIPESLATQRPSDKFMLHIGFVKDPDGNWICLRDRPDGLAAFDPDSY